MRPLRQSSPRRIRLPRIAALVSLLVLAVAPAGAQESSPLVGPLSDGSVLPLPEVEADCPTPAAFLGYPLGAELTRHDRILDYLAALAASTDRLRLLDYGQTYEGRPLRLAAISSPENLARLEELRQRRLRPATADGGEGPVFVWLAYGVHGNEASSSEAAMAVAYLLAAGGGQMAEARRQTVVLLDPAVNPDGRERYVSAYTGRRGRRPDPDPRAAEHQEPWPGGRSNHYLIDLNRDWAWATQQETRARLAAYRAWEPQIYVDFHEMASDSSYFFPPPAEPVHPFIDRRILGWIEVFGRANAAAFDRLGWPYYARDTYDLFYPGYGDSYPSLRGAVGMTYEMAGGGRAGTLLRLPDGRLLSLADRVARHLTTSLTTVETAAARARELLADFAAARARAAEEPRSFLWSDAQAEAGALAELLDLHGIRVGRLAAAEELRVRPLRRGAEPLRREFEAGSYVVSTAQPLGNLVRALLELEAPMGDAFLRAQRQALEENRRPEFFDITAWSAPLAFNLEAWVHDGDRQGRAPVASDGGLAGEGTVGFLAAPQGLASYRLAACLLEEGVALRAALAALHSGGREYPAGTLFVPRRPNPEDLEPRLRRCSAASRAALQGVESSFAERGIFLGAQEMLPVRRPRVALVRGDGVASASFGALWHLLDRTTELPVTAIEASELAAPALGNFDVVVLPAGGGYPRLLDEAAGAALDRWVRAGGVLVAIGDSIAWLRQRQLTEVQAWAPPKRDPQAEDAVPTTPAAAVADRPISTPGAALATEMRRGHPLTAGLSTPPAALVEGELVLLPTGDPQVDVVVAAAENPVRAGFVWPEAEERLAGSLLVASETRGEGQVVLFAQEPAFRLFWRGTMPLFLNALLLEPSRRGRL
jgi:hypothetical protein